jgi:predicted AAA+ superfamily ATPase
MYKRKLLLENDNNDSVFLWGARQVGKTTLLESNYPNARYYDLLQSSEFEKFFADHRYLAKNLKPQVKENW